MLKKEVAHGGILCATSMAELQLDVTIFWEQEDLIDWEIDAPS